MRKEWYHSKTLWFNFISLVVIVATYVNDNINAIPGIDEAAARFWIGLILVFGNSFLRLVTTQGIKNVKIGKRER